jgi:hypothetical protein
MKYLIVNADDYGLAPPVSAGIRQAHQNGILTSTTTMMNMPDVLPALRQAPPKLGLGLHLTLTAGYPLTPPQHLPSIMRLSDGSHLPRNADLVAHAHTLNMNEIATEWRAQIEQFLRITGHVPDHLDSHHNCSYLTYDLFCTMLTLAVEYQCAIRLPYRMVKRPVSGDMIMLPPDFPQDITPHTLAAQAGVSAPDHFIDIFFDERATKETLFSILDNLDEGITELMCHPAMADASLKNITSYNSQRAIELALLALPEVKQKVAANNIQLITFAQIPDLRGVKSS